MYKSTVLLLTDHFHTYKYNWCWHPGQPGKARGYVQLRKLESYEFLKEHGKYVMMSFRWGFGEVHDEFPVRFRVTKKCDWIWENPASMHKYKYLEIPNLIIWSIITQEGK